MSVATAQVLEARVRTQKPRTGITPDDAQRLAQGLSRSLAETYVLYVKTQGLHWNVVGPLFYGLHKLTEEQYKDLAAAADDVAERIRALGHAAPASMAAFVELSAIEESSGKLSAQEMVSALVEDHEAAARAFRELAAVAEEAHDVVTADLLTERIRAHEEAGWMLRSIATT